MVIVAEVESCFRLKSSHTSFLRILHLPNIIVMEMTYQQYGVSSAVKDNEKGNYTLLGDVDDDQLGMFDKPLPCFGCGIGWFSLLLGFVFPLMWYGATILYFGKYYHKDPRERSGLAANAIVALIFTTAVLIAVPVILL